jgi:hypothetical protein
MDDADSLRAPTIVNKNLRIGEEAMRRTILLAILSALAMPVCAIAQDHHHATVQPDAVKWSAPAAYAPGAQLAVIKGDPSKEGMYVVRLKVPAGFKIGTGDKVDPEKGTLVKAGGYSYVAKGMTHYAWFTDETVLQLHGMGPQGVTYVNPADDPRKK